MEELVAGLGQSLPGVVGSIITNQQNQGFAENMFNQSTAYNTQMADTAHQREVADLRAAGLNPILSAGGSGAPSPVASGTVPTSQNPFANLASVMQANRAQDQQDIQNEIAQQNADTATDSQSTNQQKVDADTANTEEHTRFQSNVNDAIETVLPAFKKGLSAIHDVPDALVKALFNLGGQVAFPLSKPLNDPNSFFPNLRKP